MSGMSPQTVVVAGGASGIGRAAVGHLAGLGANVAVLDLDAEGAEAVACELRDQGHGVVSLPLDVTSDDSVVAALSRAADLQGPPDALVNCVGITGQTNLVSAEVPIDDFDRVVAVNLRGAFLLSRAVLPGMAERGYGRILHVASIAGKEGNAGMVAYSATKAGLIGMVKAQGKEYAATGVTVNALAPAVIQTPLVDAMPAEQVAYMTSRIPMGRLGTLDEVAALIAFAISPSTSFVTGFTWDMSGGRAIY